MAMNPRLLRPKATSGFDPKTISGLAAWFDASVSSSVTLNSGNVSQWDDLSGNSRHATQATAGSQPSYSTAALNGKNVVVAQDNSRSLQVAAFAAGLPQTVFVVGSSTGDGQAFFQRGVVNSIHSCFRDAGTFRARRGSGNEATFSASNGYKVFTCVFTPTLARIFVGNTQGTDNTTNVTGTGAAATDNRVLTLFSLGGLYGLVGGIAEFLYYNAELAASDQDKVRSYLSKKWNVTL
jgi:hypothetical protein